MDCSSAPEGACLGLPDAPVSGVTTCCVLAGRFLKTLVSVKPPSSMISPGGGRKRKEHTSDRGRLASFLRPTHTESESRKAWKKGRESLV